MRIFFFYLTILCLPPSSIFAQIPSYPISYKLSDYAPYKGNLSCTEYRIEDINAAPQPNQASRLWFYDENGLPITEYELTPSEEDWEKMDTSEICWKTHNDKGLLTRKRCESVDYGEIISVIDYNKKGLPTKKQTACIDPPTETYIYNKKGFLQEVKVTQKFPKYNDEGDMVGTVEPLTYRYVYTTNDKGQITEEVHYAVLQGEEPMTRIKREFNDKGQIINWMMLASDGTIFRACAYTYDEKGRLIQSNQTESDEVVYYIYKYK